MTSPTLFLWDHPLSPFAQKVRIALREKNIPFTFSTPAGGGSGNLTLLDPTFVSHNPHRLEFPTLVDSDGDVKIFDSTIILEYVEDKFNEVPLRPTDAAGRAKARMIEDVCDTQYEPINWGMGELRTFKRAEGEGGGELEGRMMERARRQVREVQTWLTAQLGGAEWFGGETFGYADVCVWPFVNRSTTYGLEPELGTPLRDWYERAKERPSIQSVLEEYVAATMNPSAAYEALQKGLFKREYRDSRLEWMIKSGGIDIVKKGLEKDNIRFIWPY
jgi:glutathione S-transferase